MDLNRREKGTVLLALRALQKRIREMDLVGVPDVPGGEIPLDLLEIEELCGKLAIDEVEPHLRGGVLEAEHLFLATQRAKGDSAALRELALFAAREQYLHHKCLGRLDVWDSFAGGLRGLGFGRLEPVGGSDCVDYINTWWSDLVEMLDRGGLES